MKIITVTTKTDKYASQWLETGHMIDGIWQTSTLRYAYKHNDLRIKRDYSKTRADGDGRHEICDWTITVPESFPFEIALVTKGQAKKITVL